MEILSSFIEPLMSCIGTPVIRQFGYLFNAEENVEELKKHARDLEAMKKNIQVQLAAEERHGKEPTEEVQRWIESVDQLSLEVTAVQRDYEQSGRCGCRLPSYYKIGRRASKLVMKLKPLKEERASLTGKRLAIDAPPPSGVPQLSSALVGDMIHSNKEKICGYLKEEETDGVIGILGMGGVGKTTLLEAINDNFLSNNGNSVTNNNLFDHVIFIVVSKQRQLEKLQKIIVEKLGLRSKEGLDAQADIIYEYLKKKNFLLLLDDIWEVVELKHLGIPYPFQAGSSSISGRRFRHKVVFTTRQKDVCTGMHCHRRNIIEVDCLKKEEAWNLFKQNVGEDIINRPEIMSRAKEVIEECGNLPLALVVIGRAMATKETPGEWDNALTELRNSQPSNIEGMEEEKYFLRLKFSYDNLRNDKMRYCFLCCSLWPEDYRIEKEELIMCWMGLGLIDNFGNINEAYDKGDSLIGSLIVASLLQPVQDNGDVIKVHDVIRNLALWIACDSGTNRNKWLVKAGARLEEVPREVVANREAVERISLMENEIEDLPPQLLACPKLSTLLLQNNKFTLIPKDFFTYMPSLTYLDLSNTQIEEIPKEICCLIQLRYLNLSFTRISSLPEALGQLINLKYLLVRHTRREVKVIRGIIGRLEKLEYLDIYPDGFVETDELVHLPLLKGVGMKITSEHALQQLSRVPILYLNIKDYMEGDSSTTSIYLHQLSLRELWFINCHSIRELVDVHLPRLVSLMLIELENLTEIVWRRSIVPPSVCFQRLRDLYISGCHGLKDITWVLHLPCLEKLHLDECNGMEQLVVIGGGGEEERELEVTKQTFPRLRVLCLSHLPKLAMICDNHAAAAAVNFPSLEMLFVRDCKELKRLPFHPQLLNNNNNCSRLESIRGEREWWEGIEWEDQSAQSSLLQPFFTK